MSRFLSWLPCFNSKNHSDDTNENRPESKPAAVVETQHTEEVIVSKGKTTTVGTTVKNFGLLATRLIGQSSLPFAGLAAEIVLDITNRYGDMKATPGDLRDLEDNMAAFLYVVSDADKAGVDKATTDEFERRLRAIRDELPADTNVVKRFLNTEEIKGQMAATKEKLSDAIKLLQTSLSIQAVKDMKQFQQWVVDNGGAEVKPGDVHESFVGVTFKAGKNIKMTTTAAGKSVTDAKGATFEAGNDFSKDTTAAAIKETWDNAKVDAGSHLTMNKTTTTTTVVKPEEAPASS